MTATTRGAAHTSPRTGRDGVLALQAAGERAGLAEPGQLLAVARYLLARPLHDLHELAPAEVARLRDALLDPDTAPELIAAALLDAAADTDPWSLPPPPRPPLVEVVDELHRRHDRELAPELRELGERVAYLERVVFGDPPRTAPAPDPTAPARREDPRP